MAFWLAKQRQGQHSDWIARFDPRFWTVNFPRPMMASVISTGPRTLRVDCEFHHQGELAGLIWDSADTLDHPLLAYETRRDYAHCVLRFRWRSAGLLPLDVPHGPTLTIEGRDATGAPRSWYVRLWNYASGTPTDAQITLPFSALQSGYGLPGEGIHPADIDRIFISLPPHGYSEGSSALLPARVNGWAEMSDIACEGEGAMLEIGDVMLPAHGEQMATAYDDSYNQTPARVLRMVEQLGYRGRIVHYVGMSHYYRLSPFSGALLATFAGELCTPASQWHADYFARAVTAGFAPIISLSYELLAENCRRFWQQRTADNTYARTGWDPPSALLSPANDQAMGFLQSIAGQFVALLQAAGGAVLFQIGEPWWWTTPGTAAPCLYDPAAQTALAPLPPVPVTDMRQPLNAEQLDFLDRAGALLAASTASLAEAVRTAAGGTAEIMLLAFTPTVLDPAMPELRRVNLPTGWAWPAFDRLQLEDYDWLTDGADALRASALATVQQRLGYPPDRQDYMAGFVLAPDDADQFWPRIDAALNEARQRGIHHRYVWALPQIARDGYIRIPLALGPIEENDAVQAFDDVPYPLALGRDASVSPEFSTSVALTASGHERRNAQWSDARLRFDVGPGIRSEDELGTLIAFFRARFGPARGFRLRDPFDHSSHGMTGTPLATDQLIGTGNGLTARFPLIKSYGEQARRITHPDAASVMISIDGLAVGGWRLDPGGIIVFDVAPPDGAAIRAGFLFDVPVRFAEDRIDVSGLSFAAGEAPSVPLIEIREGEV